MKFKKALAAVTSALMLSASVCSALSAPVVSAAETDSNYAEALALSLYFYDANECGTEVDEGPLTWRGNCHTYDAYASLDSAVGLGSSEKDLIKAITGSDTVDVSGGYHDAGDHVKFSLTMGFNATSLGWAYYDYPEVFKATGTEAHLLDILQNTCDYFMKTTYLDANGDVIAFCYNVADSSDHNDWLAPEVQTSQRKTYWATASGNNSVVAFEMASALATTAHAFADIDAEYAANCLKYADALYNFGADYPGTTQDGQGDMYGTGSYNDEKAWAEAWLYVADSANHSLPTLKPSSGTYNGENDYWVYCWDKVWGGYACLMYELTGDSVYANEIKFEMDNLVGDKSQAYYPISGWGTSRYNCAWQKYAITYSEGQDNYEYLYYAKNQMDYLLGNNPTGYSFLLGYGDDSPVKIHHRAANPNRDTCTYTLYGALVGGPTTASGDYEDNTERYQYTEPALDYNACFTLAITGLYYHFGGDTTTAADTIANASEIKDGFEFTLEGYVPEEVDPLETTMTTTKPATAATTTTTTAAPTVDMEAGKVTATLNSALNCKGTNQIHMTLSDYLPSDAVLKTVTVNLTNSSSMGTVVSAAGFSTTSDWQQVDKTQSMGTSGTLVFDVSSFGDTIKLDSEMMFGLWWCDSQTATVESIVLEYEAPSEATTQATTTTTTAKPTTTTTTTTKSEAKRS